MELVRSPTGSGKNMERSGSQPNLSSVSAQNMITSDLPTVSFRNKRKYCPDSDVTNQLSEIQAQMAEMMRLLSSSINEHKESTNKIKNDIATIKNEMIEIKSSVCKTENTLITIATEHEKMKTDFQNITSATHTMEMKIASLECDLQNLKMSSELPLTKEVTYEKMLSEITDQSLRRKNLILTGIPEPQSTDFKERQKQDKDEILKIINSISKKCPEPIKIIRIGKYKPTENRAIKACFESEESVKVILRSRNKLKDDAVSIFSDQTPFQQARFKNLKEELKRRTTNGEGNLRIKYVKGVPKIVSSLPKNSTS